MLSVVLSGTMSQLHRLFPNSENGLFSRFAFYKVVSKPYMADVFASEESIKDKFISLSAELQDYYIGLKALGAPIRFSLTRGQKSKFHTRYVRATKEWYHLYGEDSLSSLRRLGLIHFRMAMVLSALRMMSEDPKDIMCTDEDYETTTGIMDVLMKHTLHLFTGLPRQSELDELTLQKREVYNALPDEFQTKDALAAADSYGMSERNLYRFLKEGLFNKNTGGHYKKAV